MKIWSETLTIHDLQSCVNEVNHDFPGCEIYLGNQAQYGTGGELSLHEGPRTRRFDHVHLCATRSFMRRNSGTYGAVAEEYGSAASWCEWGWFLARVFECDPEARANEYRGRDDFHKQTLGRFIEPRSPRKRQVQRALSALG